MEHRAPVGETCPLQDAGPGGFKDCLELPTVGTRRDIFLYTQNDLVLPGALHLFIVGIRRTSDLVSYRVGCGDDPEVRAQGPRLSGVSTEWVECPDGSSMNSGHVLLRWERGEVVYAISLHGHTDTNRSVELAIADRIEYVGR